MMGAKYVKRNDVIFAGLLLRLFSYIIDVIILVVAALLISLLWNITFFQLGFAFLLFISAIIYFTILETSPWKATAGKKLLRLQVVNVLGAKIHLNKAVIRSFAKSIPVVLLFFLVRRLAGNPLYMWNYILIITSGLLLLGALITFFISKQKQPIYDRAFGVFVIKEKNSYRNDTVSS